MLDLYVFLYKGSFCFFPILFIFPFFVLFSNCKLGRFLYHSSFYYLLYIPLEMADLLDHVFSRPCELFLSQLALS